jgi:hypothetical protein
MRILNVSNLANIVPLSATSTPLTFTHNTWVNSTDTIAVTTDERSNGFLQVYDVTNKALPLPLGSFAVAYTLMALVRDRFPRTLILLPEEIAITFAVMLAGGVLASLMAIWHALRTPPSLALGS